MLRDLWHYVVAVSRHWVTLVTGTVVALILTILAWRGLDFPREGWAIVFLVGLAFSGFLAWRDEHRRVPHPDLGVGDALIRLIELKEYGTHELVNAPVPAGVFDVVAYAVELARRERAWLKELTDLLFEAQATPGEISGVMTLTTFPPLAGVSPDVALIRGMVAERVRRLDDLIPRLEQRFVQSARQSGERGLLPSKK